MAVQNDARAEELWKKNPNLVKNGDFSAAVMAFSHGTADAQKSMGVITMALVSYGSISTFEVPSGVDRMKCRLTGSKRKVTD